ncbi:hypothetical protein [Serratia odorifera]|nr:hypothetical protein [Serratia odorifera]
MAGEKYVSQRRPGGVSRFIQLDEGPTLEVMWLPHLLPEGNAIEITT